MGEDLKDPPAEPKAQTPLDKLLSMRISRRTAVQAGIGLAVGGGLAAAAKKVVDISNDQARQVQEVEAREKAAEAELNAEDRDKFRELLKQVLRQDTNPEFWGMINDDQYFDKEKQPRRYTNIHKPYNQKPLTSLGKEISGEKVEYSIWLPKGDEKFGGPSVGVKLNYIAGKLVSQDWECRLTEEGELDTVSHTLTKDNYLDPTTWAKAVTDVQKIAQNQINHAFNFQINNWQVEPPPPNNPSIIDGTHPVGTGIAVSSTPEVDIRYSEDAFRTVRLSIFSLPKPA